MVERTRETYLVTADHPITKYACKDCKDLPVAAQAVGIEIHHLVHQKD